MIVQMSPQSVTSFIKEYECFGNIPHLPGAVLGTKNVDLNRKPEDLLKSLQHSVLSIIRGLSNTLKRRK